MHLTVIATGFDQPRQQDALDLAAQNYERPSRPAARERVPVEEDYRDPQV